MVLQNIMWTPKGDLAQLVARMLSMHEVTDSISVVSTKTFSVSRLTPRLARPFCECGVVLAKKDLLPFLESRDDTILFGLVSVGLYYIASCLTESWEWLI